MELIRYHANGETQVDMAVNACISALKKENLKIDDIDLIIPHQASKALIMVMDRLKIPKDKYIDWVSDYGNMVSVSVPFILCKLLEEKRIKTGDKLLLCGTAAGLTINMLLLSI